MVADSGRAALTHLRLVTALSALASSLVGCREYTCFDTATCSFEPDAGSSDDAGPSDAGASNASVGTSTADGKDAATSPLATDASSADVAESLADAAEPSNETRTTGPDEPQRDAGGATVDVDAAGADTADADTADAVTPEANTTGADAAPPEATSTGGSVAPTTTSESSQANATDPATAGATASSATTTEAPPDPAGYWRQDNWHGCVFAFTDDQAAGSNITPSDFTQGTDDGAYCVSGSVAATEGWRGYAMLAFNINQDAATAECDNTGANQPTLTPTEAGLAVNYVKRGADLTFILRAQIQGPNGDTDPDERWCANLIASEGQTLIPWTAFNTQCWEGGEGNSYNGEPISTVLFLVPGNGWDEGENGAADDVPFDFCINGLAAGDTPGAAPDWTVSEDDVSGELGGAAVGADYDRVKISKDGRDYVIQNNNWGNDLGAQSLSFENNGFTLTDGPDGAPPCPGCPLSFPSIYVGANGDTNDSEYTTRATDNLPAAIDEIQSIQTSARWTGTPGGAAAVSYDLWFAKPSRGDLTGQRYNDGLDGFIKLWLHDPNGSSSPQPIGTKVETKTISGISWDVWFGVRGQGPSSEGADLIADSNAPVVTYVATKDISAFTSDLKAFIDDATGRSNGGSVTFDEEFSLTDVFFGFEIWSNTSGLRVDSFTVDVQK